MPDPEPPPETPEELAGPRYALGEQFSKGGMGGLWYARESATGRTIALKRILGRPDAESFRRFLNEARITARLEHPNIVPVHGLGTDPDGQPFYTMKLVQGTDLAGVLKKLAKGDPETIDRYPLAQLLIIFQKVCDAVAFAHSHHVIHRDLKPANIMLGPFGEVLVMDWGLAKDLGEPKASVASDTPAESNPDPSSDDAGATLPGQAFGSPHYMAPEQARGDIHLHDPRTDIYALGAVLYQILALRRPVSGTTAGAILARVIDGDLDPLLLPRPDAAPDEDADLPPELRRAKLPRLELRHLPESVIPESLAAVVLRAMAFEPEKRYQSVPELQREITAYQNGFATGAERAGLGKQILLALRRHRREAAVAGIALLLLLALSVASFLRIRSERDRANAARDLASRREAEARTAQNEAEAQRNKAEKTNADLITQRAATERANSRSDLQAAQRLFESERPAESVAYLCRALQNDPTNLGALGDLVARLTELPWFYPAASTLQLGGEILDIAFGPDSKTFVVGVVSSERVDRPVKWRLYHVDGTQDMRLFLAGEIPIDDEKRLPGGETSIDHEKRLRFSGDGKSLVELKDVVENGASRERPSGRVWDTASCRLQKGRAAPSLFVQPSSYHSQIKGSSLRLVDAAGKNFGNLITVGLPVWFSFCSREGRYVMAQVGGEGLGAGFMMWRLGMDGDDANRLLLTDSDGYVRNARFSPGSRFVALDIQVNGYDGPPVTHVYRLMGNDEPLRQPMEFFAAPRVADFSLNGHYAIVGHAHGNLQLWIMSDPEKKFANPQEWWDAAKFVPERNRRDSATDNKLAGKALTAASLRMLNLSVPSRKRSSTDAETLGWLSPSGRHALMEGEKTWEIWDITSHRSHPLPLPSSIRLSPTFAFNADESLLVFAYDGDDQGRIEAAMHLVKVDSGETLSRSLEGNPAFEFSRHGRFLIARSDVKTTVYEVTHFDPLVTYRSPIQDTLWKEEEVLKLEPSSELLAAATALVGKRLSAEGIMEDVPPDEWLRLHKDSSVEPSTLTQRVIRWLRQWPDEQTRDTF